MNATPKEPTKNQLSKLRIKALELCSKSEFITKTELSRTANQRLLPTKAMHSEVDFLVKNGFLTRSKVPSGNKRGTYPEVYSITDVGRNVIEQLKTL